MNKFKDIVPIHQERELKELGFNFENEHCYLKERLSLFQVEEPYNTFDLILFSQAFRWFRKKYNLYHVITIADLGKYESGNPDFQCAIYSKDPVVITNMDKYKTYEEAELACLEKLIEIVKEKKI